MATTNQNQQLTLAELGKRVFQGKIMHIAETISEVNEIMKHAVWVECQKASVFTYNRRLSIPAGSYRKVNKGVAKEGSITTQVDENCGLLEGYSEVDQEIALESGNPVAFRDTEDRAFLEGLMQTFATKLFYGNLNTTPEEIQGLHTRYDTAGTYIKQAGGSGNDLCSVDLVQWGQYRVHLTYPVGSKAGISGDDLGQCTIQDADDYLYQGYRTHFAFKHGLAIHDDRCYGRIANIESTGGSNLFDADLMIQILRNMIEGAAGVVAYANATVLAQMDVQAMDKANVYYTSKDVFGVPTTHVRGIPLMQVDKLIITEGAV